MRGRCIGITLTALQNEQPDKWLFGIDHHVLGEGTTTTFSVHRSITEPGLLHRTGTGTRRRATLCRLNLNVRNVTNRSACRMKPGASRHAVRIAVRFSRSPGLPRRSGTRRIAGSSPPLRRYPLTPRPSERAKSIPIRRRHSLKPPGTGTFAARAAAHYRSQSPGPGHRSDCAGRDDAGADVFRCRNAGDRCGGFRRARQTTCRLRWWATPSAD